MDINNILGWTEKRSRDFAGGNDAHYIANNDFDTNVRIFIVETVPNQWKVKVGLSKEIGECESVIHNNKSFNDKKIAEIKAIEFMNKNQKLKWRGSRAYPKVSKSDGSKITKIN